MLNQFASVIFVSVRPSTYPGGYASGLHSLRPCRAALVEHPAGIRSRGATEACLCLHFRSPAGESARRQTDHRNSCGPRLSFRWRLARSSGSVLLLWPSQRH